MHLRYFFDILVCSYLIPLYGGEFPQIYQTVVTFKSCVSRKT